MDTVVSYEAETPLVQLLDRVAQGETITITRRGVPVARLVPIEEKSKSDIKQAIEELRQFRKQHPLRGLSIKDLINEGRRF